YQMTVEIRLLLELLHVVPIAARVDLPVDRGQIIARDVLAVFRELDAEAFEWAPMQSRQKSLDDRAGFELEGPETRDDRGIQKRAIGRGPGHGYIPLFGGGTASRSRS